LAVPNKLPLAKERKHPSSSPNWRDSQKKSSNPWGLSALYMTALARSLRLRRLWLRSAVLSRSAISWMRHRHLGIGLCGESLRCDDR
jgi:hypothetical protein